VSAEAESSTRERDEWFATTHWSVVAGLGDINSSTARMALEKLCRTYWYPLYAFVRRLGHAAHDAEDLVQSFFAQCIEKNYLGTADQSKGRFRSFLLIMLKRFMANEWRRTTARKRGGIDKPVALDALTAEQRYAVEPAEQMTAEQIYERRWALTLLEAVLKRLEDEQADIGRAHIFEQLKGTIVARGRATPYADIAAQLGMTESAVKVAVHRLRDRYRALLEEEIANTVTSRSEVEEERRYLLSVLAR